MYPQQLHSDSVLEYSDEHVRNVRTGSVLEPRRQRMPDSDKPLSEHVHLRLPSNPPPEFEHADLRLQEKRRRSVSVRSWLPGKTQIAEMMTAVLEFVVSAFASAVPGAGTIRRTSVYCRPAV